MFKCYISLIFIISKASLYKIKIEKISVEHL